MCYASEKLTFNKLCPVLRFPSLVRFTTARHVHKTRTPKIQGTQINTDGRRLRSRNCSRQQVHTQTGTASSTGIPLQVQNSIDTPRSRAHRLTRMAGVYALETVPGSKCTLRLVLHHPPGSRCKYETRSIPQDPGHTD